MTNSKVLVLDAGGMPKELVDYEKAIVHHAKDQVAWELGEICTTFRGGTNSMTGTQSTLSTAPIISLRNSNSGAKRMGKVPSLNNTKLFRRDNFTCAYCGKTFKSHLLTRDHIIPTSRGGKDVWENVITSCKSCNNHKDNKLLSELGWDLLFSPYVPNHAEDLVYMNANILEVQVDYLKQFFPSKTRVWGFLNHYQRSVDG